MPRRYKKEELAKKTMNIITKEHVITVRKLAEKTGTPYHVWKGSTGSGSKVLFKLHQDKKIILHTGTTNRPSYLVHKEPHKEIAADFCKDKKLKKEHFSTGAKILMTLEPGVNQTNFNYTANVNQRRPINTLFEKLPEVFEKGDIAGVSVDIKVKDKKKLLEMQDVVKKVSKILSRTV